MLDVRLELHAPVLSFGTCSRQKGTEGNGRHHAVVGSEVYTTQTSRAVKLSSS